MKKNFTSTWAMLGVLIGLVGWYVLYEGKYKPELKEKEDKTKRLVSLDADQVTEFKLSRLNTPAIEIKKTGSDWFIVAPVQSKGDNVMIESLLSSVCTTKQERSVDEKPSDLSVFGLKEPSLKIALKKDSTSPEQEIWVGNDTPVAYSIYAKTNQSDAVFKTSRTLKSSMDKDLFALRDKNVVNIKRTDVTEVEIQNGKENIVLIRSGNNLKEDWALSRDNIPADTNEWSKTLNPLIELKAIKIAAEKSDNLSLFGLNKPFAKITFGKSDKKRVTLTLGKNNNQIFAKTDDKESVAQVEKTIEEKINLPSSQYHNKHIANFDRFEVNKIKWVRGTDILEISKADGSSWKFANDPSSSIDSSQVDSFLTRLQDVQLKQFLLKTSKQSIENPNLQILLFEAGAQGEKEVVNLSFIKTKNVMVTGKNATIPFQFEMLVDDFNKINVFKQTLIKTEQKPNEADKLPKKS